MTDEQNPRAAFRVNWPWSRRPDPVPDEDPVREERLRLASALIIAEYNALRAEQGQALLSAQASIRWSLSTFGVLFAAGLLASYQGVNATSSIQTFLTPVIFLVFGFVFPGLCCLGAWIWLAEHARYERVSAQIRSLESRAARIPELRELLGEAPIRSERFRAESRQRGHAERRFGRQRLANLSTSGVFFGAIVTSEAVFVIWHAHVYSWKFDGFAIAWLALASAMLLMFLLVSLLLGRYVQRLREPTPSMTLADEHGALVLRARADYPEN